jgi:hypothetical protein
MLQRLLPLRPGLRLRCFDAAPALSLLLEEQPACILLRASDALPVMQLYVASNSLKKPVLVAIEQDGQAHWQDSESPHWHHKLPAGHSLHDLLTLVDSLPAAEKDGHQQ